MEVYELEVGFDLHVWTDSLQELQALAVYYRERGFEVQASKVGSLQPVEINLQFELARAKIEYTLHA